MSSTAFTIWTHVVASMPPKMTYTSISAPTPTIAMLKPMPGTSRLTSEPAPTICAIM
jgi:hypothetical protein